MCCEGLLCVTCHGQVADAGCGTCRAARAQLHGAAVTDSLRQAAAALVAVLCVLAALALLTA